jgi:hypothetical protein
MPRGKIVSRPTIADTDPNFTQYNLAYYHSHKEVYAVHMKNYYEKNKEVLKAKRRERYALAKAARLNLIVEISI